MRKLFFGLLLLIMFAPNFVSARVGVGVGRGKIEILEKMKPGQSYQLPTLPVYNNGDEPSAYEVTVEYHEGVPQLRPERGWIKFEPRTFDLEAGGAQNVAMTLNLPVNAKPGNYFAYLEGHPVAKESAAGGAAIGVAAAAKLYFTVVPANIFAAWYYKITTLYSRYHPYDTVVIGLLAIMYVGRVLGKKFKFQIARK